MTALPDELTDQILARARALIAEETAAGIVHPPKQKDPPPPNPNPRKPPYLERPITPADPIGDLWQTLRRGDPRVELEGWGLPESVGDIIAYRAQLRREPMQPEHKLAYISPPSPQTKQRYYDEFQERKVNVPHEARKHAAAERRKETFLTYLAAGNLIAQCCEHTGISHSTYTQWRGRDLDFRARVDGIKHGLKAPVQWDGTFAGARRYFFGYESYTHHLKIIEAIDLTPPGGVTLILLAPEAGKTSLVEDFLCIAVAENPNERILYVTETADGHARKVLSTVKERMTDPNVVDDNAPDAKIGEYIRRFGPFHDGALDKDRPWNQDYIKVHKASGNRDYTLQCAGWNSRIYGARCDLLVFDDVQSDASLGQTEKMLKRIRKTFLSRPGKKGKTIIIGTRVGVGDVYERLIEEDVVDQVVQLPALDEEGHSYCPEMWPVDELKRKRRQVGEEAWWSAYMQQPQLAEDATFTDELIDQCKHVDLSACKRPDLADNLKVVAGLDPALGGGNAIFVGAYDATRFRPIDIQIDYGLARNEDIFTKIKEMCRYHFTELVVERNSQQRGLARDDRLKELGQLFGFRIIEHETGCVDYNTEVLTTKGWCSGLDLCDSDLIYTLNMDTGNAEWKPVEWVYRAPYSGKMLRIEGQHMSAFVTADHRWPVEWRGNSGNIEGRRMVGSQDLKTNEGFMLSAVGDDGRGDLSDAIVELVGWVVTEGWHHGERVARISQSPSANPEKCLRIESALKDAGASWSVHDNGQGVNVYNVTGPVGLFLRELTPRAELDLGLIHRLTTIQRQLLADVMILGDGSRGCMYYSTSKANIEGFEMLCALTGHTTRTWIRREKTNFNATKPCWMVRRKTHPRAHFKRQAHEWVDWEGDIWCPHTSNGTFLAKRDGKVYFTGNSSKWDFNYGVGAMAGSFIRKEMQIPWGDELSERRMTPWLNELRAWRPHVAPKLQRQDMVMASWFVWLRWRKELQGMGMSNEQWKTRGTPWRPGDMGSRWANGARARAVSA